MRSYRSILALVSASMYLFFDMSIAFTPSFGGQSRNIHGLEQLTRHGRNEASISPFSIESGKAQRTFVTYATEEKTEGKIAEAEEEENLSYAEKTLKKVKESGKAGVISYALWELAFWLVSIPVCVFGYYELAGHWPDLTNKEDLEKVGAEAFAFVNFARFAVPLRLGLAFSTIPWIQENIVDKFLEPKTE